MTITNDIARLIKKQMNDAIIKKNSSKIKGI